MRPLILILLFLISKNSVAQGNARTLAELIEGVGVYTGLYKCPKNCTNSPGDFYVSDINDNSGTSIKWFTATTGSVLSSPSYIDGLSNTKNILQWNGTGGYNINLTTTLPSDINAANYSGIKNPVGAVEVCFRKNYDDSGYLIAGTTPTNMWYLPATEELQLIFLYVSNNGSAFGQTFLSSKYWSSSTSGFESLNARATNLLNGETDLYAKTTLYKIRCLRR